eukprot:11756214-Alexandrium_andersonii.AAC.1
MCTRPPRPTLANHVSPSATIPDKGLEERSCSTGKTWPVGAPAVFACGCKAKVSAGRLRRRIAACKPLAQERGPGGRA